MEENRQHVDKFFEFDNIGIVNPDNFEEQDLNSNLQLY
jgi:hypothetical protein